MKRVSSEEAIAANRIIDVMRTVAESVQTANRHEQARPLSTHSPLPPSCLTLYSWEMVADMRGAFAILKAAVDKYSEVLSED